MSYGKRWSTLTVRVACPYNACKKHPYYRTGCYSSAVECFRCNSRAPELSLASGHVSGKFGPYENRTVRCTAFRPGEKSERGQRSWPWWHPKPGDDLAEMRRRMGEAWDAARQASTEFEAAQAKQAKAAALKTKQPEPEVTP